MINAIIMASGFSTRMGQNKLLMPYKNKYIIEHTLDKVKTCSFHEYILVTNNEEMIKLGQDKGFKVIFNHHPEKGQSESIKLGIKYSKEPLGYAFFTGDQPLMDVNTIKYLVDCFYTYPEFIIGPTYKGKRGNPVIFPEKYKKELLTLQGDVGGRRIIKSNQKRVKWIEIDQELFLWDIDTIEDYNRLIMGDKNDYC